MVTTTQNQVLADRESANGVDAMSEGIDFLELLVAIRESKWLVLAITIVFGALATGAAFYMTPVYRSEVVMVVQEPEGKGKGGLLGQLGGLAELAGISAAGGDSKDESIAFLKSRFLIEDFIKQNDLMPILFDKKWDREKKRWKESLDPKEVPTLGDGYQRFNKNIRSVSVDKKTGVITLSVEWKDREMAAAWASGIVRSANENLRQRAIAEAQKSLDYLQKELQKTSVVEVQQAIFRLMESQIKTIMMANVRNQYAFKVVDPAVIAEEKDFVRPKRPMLIAMGVAGGLLLGCGVVVSRAWIRRNKKRSLVLN